MQTPHIAIIGGGMAGLSAAVTLAEAGLQSTVFEAGSTLGGRARGIEYQGMVLDNGQHIMLGVYRETLRLLALTGHTNPLKRVPLSLHVTDLQRKTALTLNTSRYLPAPLHLLAGLLSAKGLTVKDKSLAVSMMLWLKLHRFVLQEDKPLSSFLSQQKQSANLIQRLWEPLCLAALNTPLQIASTQVFLNVLRDSFNQRAQDSDVLLATKDLTRALSVPLADYLTQHDNQIHLNSAVKQVKPEANGYRIQTARTADLFSHVIMACGPHQLSSICADLPNMGIPQFDYQPITTVYLQYSPEMRLSLPMQGMVNSLGQWIFDRGQLCGQSGLFAIVISAHPPFSIAHPALADQLHLELQQLIPDLPRPLWHKVVTEKRATFSCVTDVKRPNNLTHYKNIFLAGDYTEGDYPATIEGAVRSGIKAAGLLISHSG